jgi:phosphoserine phosphatase
MLKTIRWVDIALQDRISGRICYGKVKAEIVKRLAEKENPDLSNSYAYGDDISDRYILESAGNPIVVNPDESLRKIAVERYWKIVKWELNRNIVNR